LLLRSFWKVLQVQPGFETSHLVMAHVWLPVPNDPNLNPYLKQEKRAGFVREVRRRASRLPGVQSAVIASANTPFSGQRAVVNFTIEGNAPGKGEFPGAESGSLTPDFSRTLGMPLVRGRTFTDADTETGNPVALVDQTAAERYWPNQDPIGKRRIFRIFPELSRPRSGPQLWEFLAEPKAKVWMLPTLPTFSFRRIRT
jgi:putative ABC transport system permease protein